MQGLADGIKRIRGANPDISILVFSLHVDLPLARAALRSGARGFVHAGMDLDQIVRVVEVAARGEIVAPGKLLECLIANEDTADLATLTPRQREILTLVAEESSNAQIAKRLYLSESTVKQHLRATYKVLGVRTVRRPRRSSVTDTEVLPRTEHAARPWMLDRRRPKCSDSSLIPH